MWNVFKEMNFDIPYTPPCAVIAQLVRYSSIDIKPVAEGFTAFSFIFGIDDGLRE